MNIFVLSQDPVQAARWLCNKHVPKMVVETAQLLCSAHGSTPTPYKKTHANHPCAVWTRRSLSNYRWLVTHGEAMAAEYTRRYGKIHASSKVVRWCAENEPSIEDVGLTDFAQAMPDECKSPGDAVAAYRNYYTVHKAKIAVWEPRAATPPWWTVSL